MTNADYRALEERLELEKTLTEQREWIAALEADNRLLSAQLKAAQARELTISQMYKGELLSKGSIIGELANAKGMVTAIWNWAILSGPALSQRRLLVLLKAMELVLSGKGSKAVRDEFTRDMLICQALAHVIAAKQLQAEQDGTPGDEDTEPITPVTFEPDETQEVSVVVKKSEPQESPEIVAGEGMPVPVEAMGKQVVIVHREGPAFVSHTQGGLSKVDRPSRIKIPRWPANTATPEEQAVYSSRFGRPGIVSGQPLPADFREGQTTVLESREDRVQARKDQLIQESNQRIVEKLMGGQASKDRGMVYLPIVDMVQV